MTPMTRLLSEAIHLALSLPATTYGYGETYCGDPHGPVTCDATATTASGLPFDPEEAHVAVHLPPEVTARVLIRPGRWQVCLRHAVTGTPTWLPVTDKKGRPGGLDLSPGALRLLGIEPSPAFSGNLTPCETRLRMND